MWRVVFASAAYSVYVHMYVHMYVDVRLSDAVPQHIPPANLRVNAAI